MSVDSAPDTGQIAEKLKKMVNEIQEIYESLLDSAQLYKQGKVNEKELFVQMADYLIQISSLNFLSTQMILALKSAMKGGQLTSKYAPTQGVSNPTSGSSQYPNIGQNVYEQDQQQPPVLKPVTIVLDKKEEQKEDGKLPTGSTKKNCRVCGASLPISAKFCSRCGNSQ
jgi:hypothetical protein